MTIIFENHCLQARAAANDREITAALSAPYCMCDIMGEVRIEQHTFRLVQSAAPDHVISCHDSWRYHGHQTTMCRNDISTVHLAKLT